MKSPWENCPTVVNANRCCYLPCLCSKTVFCHQHRGQQMSRSKKWGSGKMSVIFFECSCTELLWLFWQPALAADYCPADCDFTAAAFQAHRLREDPTERSGQRSSKVAAIQECSPDEREAAGCWGEKDLMQRRFWIHWHINQEGGHVCMIWCHIFTEELNERFLSLSFFCF